MLLARLEDWVCRVVRVLDQDLHLGLLARPSHPREVAGRAVEQPGEVLLCVGRVLRRHDAH
jgi:hypothetical protein